MSILTSSKLMSGMSESWTILDTTKVEFWASEIGQIGTCPECPKVRKIAKIWKISKSAKNRKNLEKSQKIDFLALWRVSYVSGQNRQKSDFLTKSADLSDLSGHEILLSEHKFSHSEKVEKKVEIFGFLESQKNRNFGLYAVGTTRRKWRYFRLCGTKKIDDFSTFWRVKEKNVPFSAILSDFVISSFFSKSHGFEGQCQSGPPNGSPSSPVIFHHTRYWKWSIYSTWNRTFGRSDVGSANFGQIAVRTQISQDLCPERKLSKVARIANLARIDVLARFVRIRHKASRMAKISSGDRNRQNR